ncbi:MAG: hypothetical protein RL508_605 [Actinomycetota bacterium]|jgi:predicted  nucleic acid-binding Zn-ribbon protein
MKVSQNQLQDLLELTATDLLLTRSRLHIEDLKQDPMLLALQAKSRQASTDFLAANNRMDDLKLELSRLETDLQLVEKRIAKDNADLLNTSVVKNAQGIQSELKTLAKRKSDLEDAELAIMDAMGDAEALVNQHKAAKAELDAELAKTNQRLEAEFRKIASGLDLQAADRKQLAERLPHELLELYAQKAKRGTPVARLSHRECGACRVNIGATDLAEINHAPADELVTCPECNAILVR